MCTTYDAIYLSGLLRGHEKGRFGWWNSVMVQPRLQWLSRDKGIDGRYVCVAFSEKDDFALVFDYLGVA
jgi:hypothetical protein